MSVERNYRAAERHALARILPVSNEVFLISRISHMTICEYCTSTLEACIFYCIESLEIAQDQLRNCTGSTLTGSTLTLHRINFEIAQDQL